MDIKIITREDLSRAEIDKFWDQEIVMDDWDYMVLVPPTTLFEITDPDRSCTYSRWEQGEPVLSKLLTGCSDNVWYKGIYNGAEYGIGVAYHA